VAEAEAADLPGPGLARGDVENLGTEAEAAAEDDVAAAAGDDVGRAEGLGAGDVGRPLVPAVGFARRSQTCSGRASQSTAGTRIWSRYPKRPENGT
jgi:hypothetical protein